MQVKRIFKQIAKERGVSVRELREEIQKAITKAWMRPHIDNETAAYQRQVPCKGESPTPEELIYYLASKI